MKNLQQVIAIVLGAGHGTRMNSTLPKVAHILAGKPLVVWVLESLVRAHITNIVLVVSPRHQTQLNNIVQNAHLGTQVCVHFAYQDTPLGTGHAVQCGIQEAEKFFKIIGCPQNLGTRNEDTHVLVAYGDTPSVHPDTFENCLQFHTKNKNDVTVIAFEARNPFGYGRILTDNQGEFFAIREEKDCSEQEQKIRLCNSGFLCARFEILQKVLPLLQNENSSKEYYLTDVPFIAKKFGYKVSVMVGANEDEFLGVNSQVQLHELENKMKKG